ncbi:MAG TPA: cytochrome c [Thermodesulfobacteriota bacterium]|nr:cytochrome c [Thermodesulfobacteriota bacterium]
MRYVAGVFAVIGILAVAAAIYVFSGFYDVSALVPHWAITLEALEVARERSIEHYSKSVSLPSQKDGKLLDAGFAHYDSMCRRCHGAPGQQQEAFARGLYPNPPSLTGRELQNAPDREVFWIVQNGLKMTAMPAFKATHSPEEIWGILLFVRKLPAMTPAAYNDFVRRAGGEGAIVKGHKQEHQTPAPAPPAGGPVKENPEP